MTESNQVLEAGGTSASGGPGGATGTNLATTIAAVVTVGSFLLPVFGVIYFVAAYVLAQFPASLAATRPLSDLFISGFFAVVPASLIVLIFLMARDAIPVL